MQTITDLLASVPPIWWQILAGALALGLGVTLAIHTMRGLRALGRRAGKTKAVGADLLTWLAASIATIVSAQGMWQFLDRILGSLHWSLRGLMFAFIEVAVVTSAVRARKNMRENYSAGIDGLAVWALTGLSAVLSALEARSIPESLFRLAAPLVAAWLWERGMAIERRRATGRKRINWRLTPERILVRAGLAEATDRTASEVDAQRRLTRVALAAKKARALEQAGQSGWKMRRAMTRLENALDAAVQHTALARDEALQRSLLDGVTAAYSAPSILALPPVAPWAHIDHPAVTGAAKHHEAVQLAGALSEWTAAIEREHDPEVSAAVTSMAAYIAGEHVMPRPPVLNVVAYPSTPKPAVELTPPSPEGRSWMASLKPWRRPEPQPDASREDQAAPVTEPGTGVDTESDRDSDRDDDQASDRNRATEQDNRDAEDWIRTRCRGRNGTGRKPSQREVADQFKFSTGWARNRLLAVQDRMTEQGYEFRPDGTVLAPRKTVTEPVATTEAPVTVNGAPR